MTREEIKAALRKELGWDSLTGIGVLGADPPLSFRCGICGEKNPTPKIEVAGRRDGEVVVMRLCPDRPGCNRRAAAMKASAEDVFGGFVPDGRGEGDED